LEKGYKDRHAVLCKILKEENKLSLMLKDRYLEKRFAELMREPCHSLLK